MINRRRFLLTGAGVVAVGGLGLWGFGRLGAEAKIVAILRRRLNFLQLDQAGLHGFARDQVGAMLNRRVPTWNRLRYHFLSAVAPSFQRYYRSADTRSRIAKAEDAFVSTYLLSSDFFINGSDESRLVRYVAFYDPGRPCSNPFARPAVEPRTTS
jgi:hypothetical protein